MKVSNEISSLGDPQAMSSGTKVSSPEAPFVNAKVIAILGGQWGDEGKGKLVDILASDADLCTRFNGGSNAGHTIVIHGEKYALHLLPCGIFYPSAQNLIGNGVVLHLQSLIDEIKRIQQTVPDILNRIFISTRAHLLFDFHCKVDSLQETERQRSGGQLGTTCRGIGPCYTSKSSRHGLRVGDLFHWESFKQRYRNLAVLYQKQFQFEHDMEEELLRHEEYFNFLKPQFADSVTFIHKSLKESKKILIEGANATMLDIDFGTYPFVTSSSTTIGGISTGLGLNPRIIGLCIGVVKAYLTRVGSGPFLTELFDETGEHLREKGGEFGTTTGRPRRCGWLDIPMIRYATTINGFDCINLTKLDVLTGLKTIRICISYQDKFTGEYYEDCFFPSTLDSFDNITPVFADYDGWEEDIAHCKTFKELPLNARRYVLAVQNFSKVPVRWVGVGPDRSSTIQIF